MSVCVLTCLGVYGCPHGQKLGENWPKIADFAPNFPKFNPAPQYFTETSPITTIFGHNDNN